MLIKMLANLMGGQGASKINLSPDEGGGVKSGRIASVRLKALCNNTANNIDPVHPTSPVFTAPHTAHHINMKSSDADPFIFKKQSSELLFLPASECNEPKRRYSQKR